MKNKIIITLILSLTVFWSCNDLIVEDLNHLKLTDVYNDPDLYPSYIEGAALDYWTGHEIGYPNLSLLNAAQVFSSSWTNYGLQDFAKLPREAFANLSTYREIRNVETPWKYFNAGIVKVNTIFTT